MTVVVDSNIFLAIVLDLPYSQAAANKYREWVSNDKQRIAPTLFEYEVVSILRRYVQSGLLSNTESHRYVDDIAKSGIEIVAPSRALHYASLSWADKIGQAKTYDAHYLALAEQESAEFWTADKRLANTMQQLGYSWVKSIVMG